MYLSKALANSFPPASEYTDEEIFLFSTAILALEVWLNLWVSWER